MNNKKEVYLYKIYNKLTNLYATKGGRDNDWRQQGHLWTFGHLKSHITNCSGSRKYNNKQDLEIIQYKLQEVERKEFYNG